MADHTQHAQALLRLPICIGSFELTAAAALVRASGSETGAADGWGLLHHNHIVLLPPIK